MISRRLMPALTARRTRTSVKGGFVWLNAMPCWAQYPSGSRSPMPAAPWSCRSMSGSTDQR